MRWDRLFEDLEDQLASEWEAERAALDTEAERLRLSRVELRDRLRGLVVRDRASAAPSFELSDGTVVLAEPAGVGADWVALEPAGRVGALVVPFGAICAIGVAHPDLLRTARATPEPSALADRMTLGFVLRDLVRRRASVTVQLARERALTGTIDRAGSDHLDIALHDAGSPRRADAVTGHRIVPFAAIAFVRLDASASVR